MHVFGLDAVQNIKKTQKNVNELLMLFWEKIAEGDSLSESYIQGKYIQKDFANECLKTWRAEPPSGGSASRARQFMQSLKWNKNTISWEVLKN